MEFEVASLMSPMVSTAAFYVSSLTSSVERSVALCTNSFW